MRKLYVLSVQRHSSVKLPKLTDFCTWRVGRGKSKFVPGPHHTDVRKIWRNFVGFQQIPLLDLAIFLVKGLLSIDLFSLSMSKVENNVE